MTTQPLTPELTRLDRLVLGYLTVDRATRLSDVVAVVRKHESRYLSRRRDATELTREVREILRGLEHVGLATSNRGWWRRRA